MFHKVVYKIKELIAQKGYWYEYLEHEPVRTSEEASKIRGNKYNLSQGAKALIIRCKRGKNSERFYVMLVIPGDKKFDKKKTQAILGVKDTSFATEEQVAEITDGIQVGGVPPFGNLFDLEVYVDKKVLENEKIIFNAGDKRISIALKVEDYLKLVNPKIVDIV